MAMRGDSPYAADQLRFASERPGPGAYRPHVKKDHVRGGVIVRTGRDVEFDAAALPSAVVTRYPKDPNAAH